MTRLIVLGASGLVGQQILVQALANDSISHIIAPTRRPLADVQRRHAKLENPIIDFDQLPADALWWKADAILCALGTTMRQAGSQAAFYRVDHDYVVDAAKYAFAAGTTCFVLNSSMGAKLNASSFYLCVKAETERDLAGLGFISLTLVRPSLLDGGERPEKRWGESLAISFSKLLGPLVPKRLRPVTTSKVAATMISAALKATPGVTVIESEQCLSP